MHWLETFFALICGHALADFVLQPPAMSQGKIRKRLADTSLPNGSHSAQLPSWQYWLTAHSLVHGGIVFLITGSLLLGLVETAIHWFIDFCKCEGWIKLRTDQLLHLVSKVFYLLVLYDFPT